jgi:hypothetical protein
LFRVVIISPVICGHPYSKNDGQRENRSTFSNTKGSFTCRLMACSDKQPNRNWKGDSAISKALSVIRWHRSRRMFSRTGQPCRIARTTELLTCAQLDKSSITYQWKTQKQSTVRNEHSNTYNTKISYQIGAVQADLLESRISYTASRVDFQCQPTRHKKSQ